MGMGSHHHRWEKALSSPSSLPHSLSAPQGAMLRSKNEHAQRDTYSYFPWLGICLRDWVKPRKWASGAYADDFISTTISAAGSVLLLMPGQP